jgi:hypothetical protein
MRVKNLLFLEPIEFLQLGIKIGPRLLSFESTKYGLCYTILSRYQSGLLQPQPSLFKPIGIHVVTNKCKHCFFFPGSDMPAYSTLVEENICKLCDNPFPLMDSNECGLCTKAVQALAKHMITRIGTEAPC